MLSARRLCQAALIVIEVLGDILQVFSQRYFQITCLVLELGEFERLDKACLQLALLGCFQVYLFIEQNGHNDFPLSGKLFVNDLQLSRVLSIVDGVFTAHLPLVAFKEIFEAFALLIPEAEFVRSRIVT